MRARADAMLLLLLLAVSFLLTCGGQDTWAEEYTYDQPLFICREMNPGVPAPDDFLGFPLGGQPCHHEEVWKYLDALAAASPRAKIYDDGETYEGRRLGHVVITSEANQARMEEIRRGIGRLADPRLLETDDVGALIEDTPAVAWLGYTIHGDELSGTDAALLLAYELAAGRDSVVEWLLDQLVVIIDPLENPDGRERFLTQITQWESRVPNPDYQAMHHAGFWPWGRGNHYLFDLNRDWFLLVHPETRGRVKTIVDWSPQLVVDAHEMSGLSTFLFSPPREPFNPHTTEILRKWRDVFASEQAAAFDEFGWSYYTGEWNEEWYPGYGSSWSTYLGAVGILYEQAGVNGSMVKQQDGTVLTYREAVHHQLVSSRANLMTLATNRREILSDFHQEKKKAIEAGKNGPVRAFYLVPGDHPERAARLAESLILQGVEVGVLTEEASVNDLHDYWGEKHRSLDLPAGTYVVSVAQPMSPLIRAILDFDIRMDSSFLEEERRELEKKGESRLYDVTAWSVPLAYGIEAYWSGKTTSAPTEPVEPAAPVAEGRAVKAGAGYGYLIDGAADASIRALAALFDRGAQVRVARKEFQVEGRKYGRGTLLLRRLSNDDGLDQLVEEVAEETGVTIYGVNTAKSEEGSDLGGPEFRLLEAPRIGVFAGPPLDFDSFGALWWLLDQEFGVRASPLDVNNLRGIDLSKYNVLVLPGIWGSPGGYKRALGESGRDKLGAWVEDGGTLVCLGRASAYAADTTVGLSVVRQRRQVLGELDQFARAYERERAAEQPEVDSLIVWEGAEPEAEDWYEVEEEGTAAGGEEGTKPKSGVEQLAERDDWERRFRPRGPILRCRLDPEHWLAYGMGDEVPVVLFTGFIYLSKPPVETPARFAGADSIRLSGLLWPEAREKWAHTAYATREAKGKGQIILFAGEPVFRGYFRGSMRMLTNALFIGPGLGTRHTPPW